MAYSTNDWAFSTVSSQPRAVAGLEILHLSPWGHYPKAATGFHAHDFWQLEVPLTHALTLATDKVEAIAPRTAVLIPPSIFHEFRYSRPDIRWLSVKFRCSAEASAGPVIRPLTGDLGHAFDSFHGWCRLEHPDESRWRSLCHSFLALLHGLLPNQTVPTEKEAWIQKVRSLSRTNTGDFSTVAQIAAGLGLTPNHLSARFQQVTGLGLKQFLDRERADLAARHLLYDALPLGEVARLCGFEDLSTFSRFMARVTGKRPGVLRHMEGKGAARIS